MKIEKCMQKEKSKKKIIEEAIAMTLLPLDHSAMANQTPAITTFGQGRPAPWMPS